MISDFFVFPDNAISTCHQPSSSFEQRNRETGRTLELGVIFQLLHLQLYIISFRVAYPCMRHRPSPLSRSYMLLTRPPGRSLRPRLLLSSAETRGLSAHLHRGCPFRPSLERFHRPLILLDRPIPFRHKLAGGLVDPMIFRVGLVDLVDGLLEIEVLLESQ